MSALDVNQLFNDIVGAASGVLNKDVTTVQGFAKSQIQAIAHQAYLIAAGIKDGSIGADLQAYFLDNLEEMAKSFAYTLVGILTVVLEKIFNAVVAVLWKAVGTAAGVALPVP
jgi:FMN-dependent NADH-azoreductase